MNSSAVLNATATVISGNIFTLTDYFVFIFLLAVSLLIGIYFGFFDGREQTTDEYLQGSHQMQVLPIAISLVAR